MLIIISKIKMIIWLKNFPGLVVNPLGAWVVKILTFGNIKINLVVFIKMKYYFNTWKGEN